MRGELDMPYTKAICPICGSRKFEGMTGRVFCLNEHLGLKGEIKQPASHGYNMFGLKWKDTPEGEGYKEEKDGES